jgi:hypothetical protein
MAYNLDITNTAALLAAFKREKAPTTFLQQRYFPVGTSFATDEVLVEYKDGNKKLAPFVAPEIGGKVVKRDGYEIKAYKPAFIAPKRPLTIDTLKKKGFGEAYYNQLTPEERALKITVDDLVEMNDMITRREEAMCAEVMQTNALSMKHYGDDNTLYETKNIAFYTGAANPATYNITYSWDSANADIIGDVAAMANINSKAGLPATDVVMGANAADAFLNNAKIQALLDNRNYNIGAIDPTEQYPEATLLAVLNCKGHKINFIQYIGSYENDLGVDTPYIDPNKIVLGAPNAGMINYGAITQIDFGSKDFTTYVGSRVPLYEIAGQVKNVALRSAPLVQPANKNPFIVATAVFS